MRGLFAILLTYIVLVLPAPGRADTTLLCENVLSITQLQARSARLGRVDDPDQVTALLASVVTQLEERIDRVSLYRLNSHVLEVSALLARIEANAAVPNQSWKEQSLHHLEEAVKILATVDQIFGCSQPIATHQIDQPIGPEDGRAKRPLEAIRNWIEQSRPGLSIRVSILVALLVCASIAVALHVLTKSRRQEARHPCKTFVLNDFPGVCSLSHIVDIASKGFKIEAPVGPLPEGLATFYFAGEAVSGRVVWSNKYYVGVQFQHRISTKLIDRVVAASNMSVEDSGLTQKALTCFAPGCHKNCPRYRATAIDVPAGDTADGKQDPT